MMSRSLTCRPAAARSRRARRGRRRMRAQRLDDRLADRRSALLSSTRGARRARRRPPRTRRAPPPRTSAPKPRTSRSRSPSAAVAQRLERVDPELVEELRARAWARGRAGASCRRARAGTSRRSFSTAGIVPVSSSAWIFSSSVLPMPGSSVTRPSRVSAATDAAPRGRPWPRCGRRRRGARSRRRARRGRQLVEERGDRGVGRIGHRRYPRVRGAHAADPLARSCPTFDEAENLEAIVARRRAVLAARAPERLTASSSSTTARPTAPGAIADRLAARARRGRGAAPHRARGLGPAYLAGFAPRARRRRGARHGDGRRLLARSRRPRAPARARCARRRRPGARLALRRRRRRHRLGLRAAARQPRRLAGTRAACWASGPRPHRRLQVLPARGARGDRPADRALAAATPSRSS